MPTLARRTSVPGYRLHKPSGQAVVTLNGRDCYLGSHDTPASRREYDRLIAEWLASGRVGAAGDSRAAEPTVNELLLAFLDHAKGYYPVNPVSGASEFQNLISAVRPLKELYGHTPAADFGPLSLMAVRRQMVNEGLSRRVVNSRVNRIRRVFRWAVKHELLPVHFDFRLASVGALRRGELGATERAPVEPASGRRVRVLLRLLPPTLRRMLLVQRMTGMRSGELVIMRPSDIDRSKTVWVYRPAAHKTQHHGRAREIGLGPRCQRVMGPLAWDQPDEQLFSPAKVVEERNARKRAARKSKVQPSQVCRRKPHPAKSPRNYFTPNSYSQALKHAMRHAEKLGYITREDFWHPHQLRHAAAGRFARRGGLEVSRVMLGHAKPDMTAHYVGMERRTVINMAGRYC